jgi:hypothetical protein
VCVCVDRARNLGRQLVSSATLDRSRLGAGAEPSLSISDAQDPSNFCDTCRPTGIRNDTRGEPDNSPPWLNQEGSAGGKQARFGEVFHPPLGCLHAEATGRIAVLDNQASTSHTGTWHLTKLRTRIRLTQRAGINKEKAVFATSPLHQPCPADANPRWMAVRLTCTHTHARTHGPLGPLRLGYGINSNGWKARKRRTLAHDPVQCRSQRPSPTIPGIA